VMSPRNAADLEWPLSEGMQVSALPPVWIAMIILLKRQAASIAAYARLWNKQSQLVSKRSARSR